MGNSPDVRIRLSAEGEKQVLDAFRKVQSEADKTGKIGSSALSRMSGELGKLTSLLPGLSFAAGIAGATLLGKKTLESADNFAKLSQKTGVSVESLSAYAHGAELSGVSTEELATALGKLAKSAAAAADAGAKASGPFKDLGVNVRNQQGGLKSLDAILGDVAEAFSRMPDGPRKTALAMEIFGKAGANLIPFLNVGRAGIAEFKAEAERLGLVLSTEAAKSAEVFNDNLTRLQGALQGVANSVLAEVAPALVSGSAEMVRIAQSTSTFKDLAHGLAMVFIFLAKVGVGAFDIIHQIGIGLGGLAAAGEQIVRAFATEGGFFGLGKGFERAKEALAETRRAMVEARNASDALMQAMSSGAKAAGAGIGNLGGTVNDKLVNNLKKANQATTDWGQVAQGIALQQLDALIEKNRELRAEIDKTIQASKVEAVSVEPILGGPDDPWEKAKKKIEETRAEIERTAEAQERFGDLIASSLAGAVTGAISFRDALRQIAQQIAFTVAKAILLRIIMAGLEKVGLGGLGEFLGFSQGGEVEGFADGGLVRAFRKGGMVQADGFAPGGLVWGAGTSTSDSILARLSRGEYVVRAAAVKRPGVLPLLEDINSLAPLQEISKWAQSFDLQVRPLARVRAYRDGGLVEAEPGGLGGPARLRAEFDVNDTLLVRRLETSSEFERVVLRMVQGNSKAVRRMLGIG